MNREIIFDDLFGPMPYTSAWWWKSYVFALDQIYVANWTYIDKILKTYIAESHSFDLKIDPLCLLWLPNSDKSVR